MKKYPIRHDKKENLESFWGDGKIALGFIVGAIGVFYIFIFIIANIGGFKFNIIVDLAPVIVSLLVAGTSTFLAAKALFEQRKMREAATDPVLVVHFGQREDARELITLNISNIGAGAALNVLLEVEEPNDDLAARDLVTNVFAPHHPIIVIRQGEKIEYSFAMGWHLLGKKPLPPFKAKLSYEDVTGAKYEGDFLLDVRSMEKLGAHKSPQMRIVTALEHIAKQRM